MVSIFPMNFDPVNSLVWVPGAPTGPRLMIFDTFTTLWSISQFLFSYFFSSCRYGIYGIRFISPRKHDPVNLLVWVPGAPNGPPCGRFLPFLPHYDEILNICSVTFFLLIHIAPVRWDLSSLAILTP